MKKINNYKLEYKTTVTAEPEQFRHSFSFSPQALHGFCFTAAPWAKLLKRV